ncbi:hypothetical protein [Polaribacter sp. HL-MS24]|uniref:hypothetical protein n=1 Tax=Polaribacter sp. HL-MS24 TaxID=3077735 RepID=UPI0029346BB4|nr:hypothetical protein [Polaribacter sp. HL-MS24]WOC40259.1 hypothetical protein RRF69_00090 [Polaribacter sp. HL-MS24]
MEWTLKEFELYVLLYAAHSNHIEDIKEQDYLLTLYDEATFNKMHTEVVFDNDIESLTKIQDYLHFHNYTRADRNALLQQLKKVFFADGTVDLLEKNAFSVLKKILD